jgi:hypothetical protein
MGAEGYANALYADIQKIEFYVGGLVRQYESVSYI